MTSLVQSLTHELTSGAPKVPLGGRVFHTMSPANLIYTINVWQDHIDVERMKITPCRVTHSLAWSWMGDNPDSLDVELALADARRRYPSAEIVRHEEIV